MLRAGGCRRRLGWPAAGRPTGGSPGQAQFGYHRAIEGHSIGSQSDKRSWTGRPTSNLFRLRRLGRPKASHRGHLRVARQTILSEQARSVILLAVVARQIQDLVGTHPALARRMTSCGRARAEPRPKHIGRKKGRPGHDANQIRWFLRSRATAGRQHGRRVNRNRGDQAQRHGITAVPAPAQSPSVRRSRPRRARSGCTNR